jgi:hypothetical protein
MGRHRRSRGHHGDPVEDVATHAAQLRRARAEGRTPPAGRLLGLPELPDGDMHAERFPYPAGWEAGWCLAGLLYALDHHPDHQDKPRGDAPRGARDPARAVAMCREMSGTLSPVSSGRPPISR